MDLNPPSLDSFICFLIRIQTNVLSDLILPHAVLYYLNAFVLPHVVLYDLLRVLESLRQVNKVLRVPVTAQQTVNGLLVVFDALLDPGLPDEGPELGLLREVLRLSAIEVS